MTSQPVPEKVHEQFAKLAVKTGATQMVRCHDVLIVNFGPQAVTDVKFRWRALIGREKPCKNGRKTVSTKSTP